ncbi:protein-L-isoaspartate O-methyltransferase [uncultured Enterovirga sp.]|uniref:protein-L-isoaspartate O-methyltransferase family protein n=1 Tax=uncultured Enterovirga sp. TaxID=2026352 RepID=UPI0035CCA218
MIPFAAARRNMVDCQIRTFDVHDRAILAAMDEVPREAFVPEGLEDLAYGDAALSFEADQSGADHRAMLSPMVLARLLQALRIGQGMRVLDVAGARGYSAAILSRLGANVTAVESRSDLAPPTAGMAGELLEPVTWRQGDLAAGCAGDGPFQAILINGAVQVEPTALLDQLADGGQLACLRANGQPGRAMLYVRSGTGIGSRALFDAAAPVLDAFRTVPAFAF